MMFLIALAFYVVASFIFVLFIRFFDSGGSDNWWWFNNSHLAEYAVTATISAVGIIISLFGEPWEWLIAAILFGPAFIAMIRELADPMNY